MIRFLSLLLLLSIQSMMGADFYVSPRGSDDSSGTLEQPFASLERARDAVRELKTTNKNNDIVVQIRGGHYRLKQTVVFGLEDSGANDQTITYEAYPNESPIFHSDNKIKGWRRLSEPLPYLPKAAEDKVWVTDTKLDLYTLYDRSQRLPRARSEGFQPVMPENYKAPSKNSRYQLHFPKGKLRQWHNLADIDLVIRPNHAWILNILPLKSVNEQTQLAQTSVAASYAMDRLHFLKDTDSVWIENAIDYLDQPGEWVLDRKTGKLYLWPKNPSTPKGITSPMLKEYIRVEGNVNVAGPTDIPVRNLVFRGLTFTRGKSDRMSPIDKGLQHDWEFHDKANAVVRFRGAENCKVVGCKFTNSGGVGLRFDLYAQKNTIESNHFEKLGGTGILISGYGPGTKDVSHHNQIVNNHIHHVGEIYAHSPGIFLWQSGNNRVANNLIHHTPYSGMIISGVMEKFFVKTNARELVRTIRWHEIGKKPKNYTTRKPYLHTHDNIIELNEIHHVMEFLGDGNGIYIRGAGSNNIIRRNYIHHMVSPVALQAPIRTDGGQRDTLITENVIYNCVSQGIQLKLNNRAINNFIVDLQPSIHNGETRPPSYMKLREGPMDGAVIQRNIFYHSGESEALLYDEGRTPRLENAWAKEANTNHNLYFFNQHPEIVKNWLKKSRKSGIESDSKSGDPLFVDRAGKDFRFQANSIATKLGIEAIDLSNVGLLKK